MYFYGGTSPVDRSFGGRYPKEWWAANGYVVVVLNPAGATGYGQTRSAVHTDDWGYTPVNHHCVTNLRHIYAAGDVSGKLPLASVASSKSMKNSPGPIRRSHR